MRHVSFQQLVMGYEYEHVYVHVSKYYFISVQYNACLINIVAGK